MSVRRVLRSPGSHLLPHDPYRARVTITTRFDEPVAITYYRYTVPLPHAIGPRLNATNAVLVEVSNSEEAPNLDEGKAIARETMRGLASGEIFGIEKPFPTPIRAERIAEFDHLEKMLQAVVLRWPQEYEVRTVGYLPNGYTLPVATPSISTDPDYEWGRLDLSERLLCDTLEEAATAAREELERLAASDVPARSRE